ncbi:unnamed protein product [Orchesella dallaii]|uniref:Uncharacterized protein n=1 Tax=Orchesella dallaii TaxID=48710 RepID=A0ABP1QYT3_9HEXA
MAKAYHETGTINPEEIVIGITAFAMSIQGCVTTYAMEKEPKGFVYSVTQTLKAGGVTHLGWPNSRRLPDFSELIGYGIAIILCNFPLIVTFYPLLRDQDPLNVELKDALSPIPRRILAVVLLESLVQDILKFVFTNLENMYQKTSKIQPSIPEPLPLNLAENCKINFPVEPEVQQQQLYGSDMSLDERFQARRKRHITIHLMMDMSNNDVEAFVPTMAAVGMMLCIIFNYAVLTLHSNPEMQMFLLEGLLLFVAINFMILFLCHHASLPLINTTETSWFWKGRQTRKLERTQLRCMRPFGFKLGRFFYAKRDTALEINDIILNVTITLLLA